MRFRTDTIHATHIDTALGGVLLAATDLGLCGLWFDAQRHAPRTIGWRMDVAHPVLRAAASQLTDYVEGRRRVFDLPLDLSHGTAFQQAVWQELRAIPRGATLSYGAIGQRLGRPMATRAVGGAVGRNPISVVVPCHRVVGASGALTGYAGGLDRKRALLALESAG